MVPQVDAAQSRGFSQWLLAVIADMELHLVHRHDTLASTNTAPASATAVAYHAIGD